MYLREEPEPKNQHMKNTLLLALLLTTGTLLGQANNYPNGSTVANFTITDTDGNTHDLYEYTAAGKHVLATFFFYNCGPCQAGAPRVAELYEMYGCNSQDLIVLRINRGDDSDAQVAAFGGNFGGDFNQPPAIGSGGSAGVRSAFGISAYPTYCLITPDNVMHNNDIWPVPSVQTFIDAFPAGSNIQQAACVLSVNELDQALEMNVFPSPTNGPITAAFELRTERRVELQLVDALGRETARWDLGRRPNGNFVETFDLSGQPNGAYLLRALTEDGVSATWRIVVAR